MDTDRSTSPTNTVLGLDIGVASVGWALIDDSENNTHATQLDQRNPCTTRGANSAHGAISKWLQSLTSPGVGPHGLSDFIHVPCGQNPFLVDPMEVVDLVTRPRIHQGVGRGLVFRSHFAFRGTI